MERGGILKTETSRTTRRVCSNESSSSSNDIGLVKIETLVGEMRKDVKFKMRERGEVVE